MSDPQAQAIGVVIVDDHRMFAESLARLLAHEEGITVLGIAADATQARALVRSRRPRVLLVDFGMPGENGVLLTAKVKRDFPDTMVVMITGSAEDGTLVAAIEAGCSGFLTKDGAVSDVARAVRVAAAGEALVSPTQLARVLPKLSHTYRALGSDLTQREIEVLNRLASGMSNKAIAAELFLSVNTIRNRVQAILTKLGAHSKLEAVSVATREGIVGFARR